MMKRVMKKKVPKSVILSFRIVNPASLDVLAGVLKYIRERHPWNVRLIMPPMQLTREIVQAAESEDVCGILVNHPLSTDLGDVLRDSHIPLVTLGNTDDKIFKRRRNVAFLGADDRQIGCQAARYFLRLGRYRSFAFLPDIPTSRWSRLRLRGYRSELLKRGHSVRVFSNTPLSPPCNTVAYDNAIKRWLLSLPRPTAVLLAGDYHGSTALEMSRAAGLSVPQDISILGVDNNPIYCESSQPRLSSIEPDYKREGYEGAQTLDRMMRLKKPMPRPLIIKIPFRRIVTRNSTSELNLGTSLVDRALDYIAANVQTALSVSDVARHLGVSQTLLNLRFRQYQKSSVYENVIRIRLERVAALLRNSNTPLSVIAEQFGFSSASHLSHLFKQKYGVPPSCTRGADASRTSFLV